MIKCNVKVCGIIKGTPSVHTAKDGTKFTSFDIGVVIPAKNGINKTVDVSVGIDGNESDLAKYQTGMRVEALGTMTMRKRENVIYFNLRATSVGESEGKDEISGTITFRGTVGKSVDERKDKKGRDYYNFSAFTTEKNGETYSFIWVRFVRFSAKREDWLQPGVGFDANGELEITVFNENIYLGCRISDIAFWNKAAATNAQVKEEDPTSVQPF